MDQLQRTQNDSKSKIDTSHSSQIVSIETKYNQRLKELTEQSQLKDHENMSKVK